MHERNKASWWIEKLNLVPHPEGGYYAEVFRSEELIPVKALPERYPADRPFSTSIYYLLEQGDYSAFHRISSDEMWYFHDGDLLEMLMIDRQGRLHRKLLGNFGEALPQLIIPHGHWFAVHPLGAYSLVGCNVAPGFDFADFSMGSREELSTAYPHLTEVIRQFTRG